MSRQVSQNLLENFIGGVVSEASLLAPVPNSLRDAINVYINKDGSIKDRPPYSLTDLSIGPIPPAGNNKITVSNDSSFSKVFYWPAQKATVIFFPTSVRVIKNGAIVFSSSITAGTGFLDNLDVAFSEDYFLFNIQVSEDVVDSFPGAPLYVTRTTKFPLIHRVSLDREGNYSLTAMYEEVRPTYTTSVPAVFGTVDGSGVLTGPGIIYNPYWLMNDYRYPDHSLSDTSTSNTYTVDNRTYYRGTLQTTKDVGGVILEFYSIAYDEVTEGEVTKVVGCQPLYYRDFEGFENATTSWTGDGYQYFPESYRLSNYMTTPAPFLYNLRNAGWKEADNVNLKIADDKKGSAVSTVTRSLAASAVDKTFWFPSLCDASYEYLTSTADNKDALGVFNPFLMKDATPTRESALRGSIILAMGKEYRGIRSLYKSEIPLASVYYPQKLVPAASVPNPLISNPQVNVLADLSRKRFRDSEVTALEKISGRVWYAVGGQFEGVFFSQLKGNLSGMLAGTELKSDVCCYQKGDPTSEYDNSLLETDGGVIPISGCGKIYKILDTQFGVTVVAEEGVWAISGELEGSFTPTSFSIKKISDLKAVSGDFVANLGGFLYLLTKDTFYRLSPSGIEDISTGKIFKKMKKFLSGLTRDTSVGGIYTDLLNGRLFVYKQNYGSTSLDHCKGQGLSVIVFDAITQAFTMQEIGGYKPTYSAVDGWIGAATTSEESTDYSEWAPLPISIIEGTDREPEILCVYTKLVDRTLENTSASVDTSTFRGFKELERMDGGLLDFNTVPFLSTISLQTLPINPFQKSNSTRHFSALFDMSDKYVKYDPEDLNDVRFPKISATVTWDRMRDAKEEFTIQTNRKYPISRLEDSDLDIIRHRITGSGKFLDISLQSSDSLATTGFRLDGFLFEFDVAQ